MARNVYLKFVEEAIKFVQADKGWAPSSLDERDGRYVANGGYFSLMWAGRMNVFRLMPDGRVFVADNEQGARLPRLLATWAIGVYRHAKQIEAKDKAWAMNLEVTCKPVTQEWLDSVIVADVGDPRKCAQDLLVAGRLQLTNFLQLVIQAEPRIRPPYIVHRVLAHRCKVAVVDALRVWYEERGGA